METFENMSYVFIDFDYNETLEVDFNNTLLEVDFNNTLLEVDYRKPKSFILYLLVFAVGLIGNATVLCAVLRFIKMWTTTNIYIFSLALGDLLNMFNLLLFAIEIASFYWPLGTFMCKLFWTLMSVTTFSNVYIMILMTISIFTQSYFPTFSKKRLGPKYALLTSLLVWIICLLLGIPTFIYGDLDEYNSCRIIWPDPVAFWNLTFLSCTLAMAFLVPLMLMAILLILMVVRARNQEKSSEMDFGSIKETMVLITALCLVYAIFWLPTHVMEMMNSTMSNMHIDEGVYYIISLIPYLKSCVYPFLYGFLSQSFKTAFKQIFCCKKLPMDNGPHQDSTEG